MLQQLLTVIIGLVGGISVGMQTPISNATAQRVGGTSSSFIIHVGGAIFSGLLLFLRGGENIKDIGNVPLWMLGSGIFGVVLFLTINVTIPRIGALAAVALIIVGQLITGTIIDHFGLFGVTARPVDLTRLVAVGLLLAGGYLISK